jgi:hypothetical protein
LLLLLVLLLLLLLLMLLLLPSQVLSLSFSQQLQHWIWAKILLLPLLPLLLLVLLPSRIFSPRFSDLLQQPHLPLIPAPVSTLLLLLLMSIPRGPILALLLLLLVNIHSVTNVTTKPQWITRGQAAACSRHPALSLAAAVALTATLAIATASTTSCITADKHTTSSSSGCTLHWCASTSRCAWSGRSYDSIGNCILGHGDLQVTRGTAVSREICHWLVPRFRSCSCQALCALPLPRGQG